MAELFVIRNQLGHYWGKSKAWVDGSDARAVKHTGHRDDAVNTLFELSSKDFELRGEVLAVEATERGDPVVEASQIPLPMDEAPPEAELESGTPAQEPEQEPAAPG
jgi:hypothetical protein